MRSYRDGDYSAAENSLRKAAELSQDHPDVFLFLGSARLLLGGADEGVRALRRAVENAQDVNVLAECKWQLANAYLASGNAGPSVPLLREVAELDPERRGEAEELLALLVSLGAVIE